jgi:hypothetical protein
MGLQLHPGKFAAAPVNGSSVATDGRGMLGDAGAAPFFARSIPERNWVLDNQTADVLLFESKECISNRVETAGNRRFGRLSSADLGSDCLCLIRLLKN